MRHIKLVIFDLDGTLMDAYNAVFRSINYAMDRLKHPRIDAETIKRTVGWGDRHLLEVFVGKTISERALKIYRRHHKSALQKRGGTKFLPGARKLLGYLKQKGYRLAVATNRPTVYSRIALRQLGVLQDFDYVLCGDRVPRPKPHPDILRIILKRFGLKPVQALYVGDMVIDVKTGRAARIRTVAVTTGSSSRRELAALKPYRVIHHVFDVAGIVDALC